MRATAMYGAGDVRVRDRARRPPRQRRHRRRPVTRTRVNRGLLPDVFEGKIEPGRVFDRVSPLDDVPDGYRAMNEREALKVLIEL